MTPPRRPPAPLPRDVLAAEEFAIGAGDPGLHREPPHDVLAAEEFAIGAAEPIAPDPEPAHDVLAAEEFVLPAPEAHAVPPGYPATAPVGDAGSATRVWRERATTAAAVAGVAALGATIAVVSHRRGG